MNKKDCSKFERWDISHMEEKIDLNRDRILEIQYEINDLIDEINILERIIWKK